MLKNLLSYKIKIFASYFIINENIKKNLLPMGRFSMLSYAISIARINRVEIKIFTRYLTLITPSPFIIVIPRFSN